MKRLLTAVVVLPFLIASILISSLWWVFLLLAVAAMVLGLWEFYLLAKRLQLKPDPAAGYIAGAALVTIPLQNDPAINVLLVQFVIIALTIGTLIAATLRGAPFDKMIASTGATILGVLYIPLLGSHLIAMRVGFDPTLSSALAVVLLSRSDGSGCRCVLHRPSIWKTQTRSIDQSRQDVGRRDWRSCSRARHGSLGSLLVLS